MRTLAISSKDDELRSVLNYSSQDDEKAVAKYLESDSLLDSRNLSPRSYRLHQGIFPPNLSLQSKRNHTPDETQIVHEIDHSFKNIRHT